MLIGETVKPKLHLFLLNDEANDPQLLLVSDILPRALGEVAVNPSAEAILVS